MNITQLRCYWEVMLTGSFSKAAESLFMSQPSVSKHIMALENEMGVSLLDRNGKRFKVSESGRALIPHIRALLEAHGHLSDALETIKVGRAGQSQTIRFASIPTVALYGVVASIKHFITLNPGVEMLTEEMEEDRLLLVLESGGCDLAFVSTERLDTGVFDSQHYVTDNFTLAVTESSEFARRGSVRLADLSGCKMILNRKESSLYDLCKDACVKAGFEPNVQFTTSRPDIALAYLLDGSYAYMGITRAIRSVTPDSGIRLVPIEDTPSFEYHFAWAKKAPPQGSAKKYLEYASSHKRYFIEQVDATLPMFN